MAKPSLAIVSLTGCTGCVVSILDLHEEILEVLDKVDLVYCTTVLDVKEIPKCDIALVDGTVANEADVEHAKEIREKAGKIISLGSCACFGGITGLKNLFGINERIITYIQSNAGMTAVIKVGAFNVGRMSLAYEDIFTNRAFQRKKEHLYTQDKLIQINTGDEIGTFHLGSTIILLFSRDMMDFSDIKVGNKIRMGSKLGGIK